MNDFEKIKKIKTFIHMKNKDVFFRVWQFEYWFLDLAPE